MNKTPTIGIIGLGIMGHSMALNAQKAGFSVICFNRTLKKGADLIPFGIALAESPRVVGEKADIIVTIVTGPKALQDVLLGPQGLLESPLEGKIFIQMSTIDYKTTLRVANEAKEAGMRFLDCPVTGSKKQVDEAQLILLAGGDEAVIDEVTPFLSSVGKSIIRAGEIGKGTSLKLCMNMIVAQMTTALCESVSFAKIQNLDPAKIFEVLEQSPALNCGYFRIKQRALIQEDYSPAFSLSNMLKDVRFMDEYSKEKNLPLKVTHAVREVMEEALAKGYGEEDLTSLVKIMESSHYHPKV